MWLVLISSEHNSAAGWSHLTCLHLIFQEVIHQNLPLMLEFNSGIMYSLCEILYTFDCSQD